MTSTTLHQDGSKKQATRGGSGYSSKWDLIVPNAGAIRNITREAAFNKEIQSASKECKKPFISLTFGDPALFGLVNEAVVPAIKRVVEKEGPLSFTYPEISGMQQRLGKAISQFEKKFQGVDYDPSNIMITTGVAGAFNVLHYALLDPGDEVIAFSPSHYVATSSYLKVLGAKLVQVQTKESNGWLPLVEELRAAISPKTKIIVVNSPTNPTGAVYPEKTLKEIADVASEFGVPIVSDEIYGLLTYGNVTARAMGHFVGDDNMLITVSGASKIFAAPGMRVGYICLKPDNTERSLRIAEIVKHVGSTYGHVSSGVSTPMMAAAAELYGSDNLNSFRDVHAKLASRRETVVRRMKGISGLSLVEPAGALYFFPRVDLSEYEKDEYSFLLELAREEGVTFSPGTHFGEEGGSGHFRGVFLADNPILTDAMDRLENFCSKRVKR